MVKLVNLAYSVICWIGVISPVFADSWGSYLWDPPVDNEANVYARVIELKHAGSMNGKLLATWEHWYTLDSTSMLPNGTEGNFIIRESDDAGNSWNTLTTVRDTQTGPGHPCARFWQPFFFEFPRRLGKYPEGTLLLVGNLVPTNKTFTEFFTWRSMDHGRTWDPVGAWQHGGTTGVGIWEPFLYLDNRGRLVAIFSDERDTENHSQMLVHVVSEDGGDSWGEVVRDVASTAQTDRPGMATVALMDNGDYIMSYEICGRPNCPVHVKTSKDGVTWNAGDVGSSVITDGGIYPGSSPYTIWDPSTKQVVLASHAIWSISTDTQAPEFHRAVFINKNHGKGAWFWSPSPWYVYNGSGLCNSNYSPNLLPLSKGIIRYTAPASEGTSGLCSERTGEAPIGMLPYYANFSANGQSGWINFGGNW
ncbi:Sialidase, partial [Xylogone sp. PMI_703]